MSKGERVPFNEGDDVIVTHPHVEGSGSRGVIVDVHEWQHKPSTFSHWVGVELEGQYRVTYLWIRWLTLVSTYDSQEQS